MNTTEVKFGEWIKRGLDLYKIHWLTLIVVSAVWVACFCIPIWILSLVMVLHPVLGLVLNALVLPLVTGPLSVGLNRVVLQLQAAPEQKIEIGVAISTVFQGYQQFKDAYLLTLMVGAAIALVQIISSLIFPQFLVSILGMVVTWLLGTAFLFSVWLLADRKCDFVTALRDSWAVTKTNFWAFLGFMLVSGLIGAVGLVACCIGVVATAPITFCIVAMAYRDIFTPAAVPQVQPPAL